MGGSVLLAAMDYFTKWPEAFDSNLAQQLAVLTAEHQRDRDVHLPLPLILMACQSAVEDSTACTPALLVMGREPLGVTPETPVAVPVVGPDGICTHICQGHEHVPKEKLGLLSEREALQSKKKDGTLPKVQCSYPLGPGEWCEPSLPSWRNTCSAPPPPPPPPRTCGHGTTERTVMPCEEPSSSAGGAHGSFW